MIQKQQQRVEKAVTKLIEDIYQSQLKKMQYEMHVCSSACCQKPRSTLDDVTHCIENCAQPLMRAQQMVSNELSQFQGRLQSCVMVFYIENLIYDFS